IGALNAGFPGGGSGVGAAGRTGLVHGCTETVQPTNAVSSIAANPLAPTRFRQLPIAASSNARSIRGPRAPCACQARKGTLHVSQRWSLCGKAGMIFGAGAIADFRSLSTVFFWVVGSRRQRP